jgi:hypothetical protein
VISNDIDMERMLLRYFINDEWAARGAQSVDSIFEQIGRPSGWMKSYFDRLQTPEEKGALGAILDRMARDGLLDVFVSQGGEKFYEASKLALSNPHYERLFPRFENSPIDLGDGTLDASAYHERELRATHAAVDSTDWTGLAKSVSAAQAVIIREKSNSLLATIMQSDADIQTRTDACKRIEAVLLLLEAPNVPWREVVGLLTHPTVTAFLAALSLIQFIIGMAPNAQTH